MPTAPLSALPASTTTSGALDRRRRAGDFSNPPPSPNPRTWWPGGGRAILARMNVDVAALTGQALADPPCHLDEVKVSTYAQILDQLPPVVVFELDDGLLLVDGYHRVEAARRLGRTVIQAEVRQGSRADALRFAVDLAAAERGMTKAHALDAIKRRSGKRWDS